MVLVWREACCAPDYIGWVFEVGCVVPMPEGVAECSSCGRHIETDALVHPVGWPNSGFIPYELKKIPPLGKEECELAASESYI